MKIFNGYKALAAIAVIWAFSFWFLQYSEITNPDQVVDMLDSYAFTIFVASTVYTIPLFFFSVGFLQTYSFMQQPEQLRYKSKKLTKYMIWKLIKFWPINAISLVFMVVLESWLLGSGPIWSNFDKTVEPCKQYWWTNLVWISNLYPLS